MAELGGLAFIENIFNDFVTELLSSHIFLKSKYEEEYEEMMAASREPKRRGEMILLICEFLKE